MTTRRRRRTDQAGRRAAALASGAAGVLLFLLDAGGAVWFGPDFRGDVLLAPAWGLLLAAFYVVLGAPFVALLLSGIRALGGLANVIAEAGSAALKDMDDDATGEPPQKGTQP